MPLFVILSGKGWSTAQAARRCGVLEASYSAAVESSFPRPALSWWLIVTAVPGPASLN